MGMFAKCKGPGWGCLIGLLRDQNLRKVQVWTLPRGKKLAWPKCELGVAGAVSWIKPPPPPRAWVLTLAGVSHLPASTQANFKSFPEAHGEGAFSGYTPGFNAQFYPQMGPATFCLSKGLGPSASQES